MHAHNLRKSSFLATPPSNSPLAGVFRPRESFGGTGVFLERVHDLDSRKYFGGCRELRCLESRDWSHGSSDTKSLANQIALFET